MASSVTTGNDILRPRLPRRLQVEVTGSCNLRCRMCIVRYRPTLGRSASMSFATFRRLLDELPDVNEVVLQGIGEPLLAPDIFEMVEYCGRRGLDVGFNTNVTLLNRRAAQHPPARPQSPHPARLILDGEAARLQGAQQPETSGAGAAGR